MTLQDLMMLYGVTLGKRRTAKQKYLFAQQLNESLPPLGWPVRVQQREGRFSKTENLIAGDLANAKVVIAVPFDTPAKALRPQKYYPFHPDKNVQQRGRDLALQCVLELLCFGAACLMFWSGRGTGAMLPRTLAALLLAGVGVWLLLPHASPCNFSRCSGAVATAVKLAEDLSGEENIAFAFCDHAVDNYDGFRLLAQEMPTAATVLLLDNLTSGPAVALAHGEYRKEAAEQLCSLLPEDKVYDRNYPEEQRQRNLLALFPRGMMLSCGRVEKGEFVVENTCCAQDHVLDLPRMERMERALADFAKQEANKKEN